MPGAPGADVVFLSYLSRSGSTLLARLLQERWRVSVAPEGSLPAELLGVNGFAPPRFAGPEAALAHLASARRVSKLDTWGLDLEAALSGGRWPADGPEVVARLLRAWRDARSPGDALVCYKGDPVMPWEAARAMAALPGSRTIFVLRDPRAVLHSQRSSRYAYSGGAFSYSVAHTAEEWRRLAAAVEAAPPGAAVVRYEALVRDPDAALGALAAALGARPREGAAPDFLDAVPEAERHLHRLVGAAPLAERAEGWRSALDPAASDLLQEMLRETMPRLGYPLEQRARPSRRAVALSRLRHRLRLAAAEAARHGRTALADPGYFLAKLRARVVRPAGGAGR